MYGTICRFQIKPGMNAQLARLTEEYDSLSIIGMNSELVFQMDSNPNEYFMVVAFDSEEAYKRNAASPDQDARYRMLRDLLAADPEWYDGSVVYTRMRESIR